MARRKIPSNTNYFTFVDANPKNRITGDCVIRAISLALDKSWDDVLDDLVVIAHKIKCSPTDTPCYSRYLKSQGFTKFSQMKKYDGTKYTGKEFCDFCESDNARFMMPVIAHIGSHHITEFHYSSGEGVTCHDTWDCTSGCVGVFWARPF